MALTDKLRAIGEGFRLSRETTKEFTLEEMAVLAAEKAESVPDGTDVTFGNVEGIPVEREEAYAIASADLNALGAITQKMAGKSALMTIADMVYWLNRVIYIPQGNAESEQTIVSQISTASGRLPVVQRGTAISIQSISSTSNAVGSLESA